MSYGLQKGYPLKLAGRLDRSFRRGIIDLQDHLGGVVLGQAAYRPSSPRQLSRERVKPRANTEGGAGGEDPGTLPDRQASRTRDPRSSKRPTPVGVLEGWSARQGLTGHCRNCPRQRPQARGWPGPRFQVRGPPQTKSRPSARHGETLGQRRYITGMHLGADVMLIVTRVTPGSFTSAPA